MSFMEKIEAEPERAIEALSIATELLVSAKEKADTGLFNESLILSRDSMRIASSAILFHDGLVAGDFDSCYGYLKKEYGKSVPLDEWKEVEKISGSVESFLGRIFGRGNKDIEKNAMISLDSAVRFLKISNEIVYGE